MKQRKEKFRVGNSTYFHHKHGIVVRKNRRRQMALTMSAMVMLFGGFFVGREYALPLLRNNAGLARAQQLVSQNLVSAQADPDNKNAQPIRTEDELLKSVLEDKIETFPSDQKWAVYVYDLNTERTAFVNTGETFGSASLYKLFLLEALESKLPYDKWQWTWVGGKSVAECVDKMLRSEDDPCAQDLGQFIGWDKIDELNHKNGYKNTRLNGNGRETTASDVGELLARLKKGQALSDYARRSIFDSLYQQVIKKGMAKACGDCRTANKLGELTGVAHDAGIVTHGNHNYVFVVMSEGGSFKQIEEITKIVESQFAPSH